MNYTIIGQSTLLCTNNASIIDNYMLLVYNYSKMERGQGLEGEGYGWSTI